MTWQSLAVFLCRKWKIPTLVTLAQNDGFFIVVTLSRNDDVLWNIPTHLFLSVIARNEVTWQSLAVFLCRKWKIPTLVTLARNDGF